MVIVVRGQRLKLRTEERSPEAAYSGKMQTTNGCVIHRRNSLISLHVSLETDGKVVANYARWRSFLTTPSTDGSRVSFFTPEVLMVSDNNDEKYSEIKAADFDRDPAAAYKLASQGPVTILDSSGRPSMTLIIPRGVDPVAAE